MTELIAYLGLGIVFRLRLAPDDGVLLVRVDEVARVVAHDAGGARVDEGLDAGLLARGHDGARAVDVDPLEEGVDDGAAALGRRRRRVDHDVGRQPRDRLGQPVAVRDVRLHVLDPVRRRPPVPRTPQVDHRHGAALPVAQQHPHHVVAEEPAPADHEDAPQGRLFDFVRSHCRLAFFFFFSSFLSFCLLLLVVVAAVS